MATHPVHEDSYLSRWLCVREYAVPPVMIEQSTARRATGDWAGACAAAHVDVDLDLRTVNRALGREFTGQLRSDLRHLAPDLLRWHLPRSAPDGLLRGGLTLSLARYRLPGRPGPVHLVARTPPVWADGGQRFALALWSADDGTGSATDHRHPRPRPDPRFRLDLHRHLWDARRAGEFRERAGSVQQPQHGAEFGPPYAVDRWAAEAALLREAEGRPDRAVVVRLDAGRRLVLEPGAPTPTLDGGELPLPVRRLSTRDGAALPVLPDAATWTPPDLVLLHSGAIDPGRLHPLVAASLVPDGQAEPPTPPDHPDHRDHSDRSGGPLLVDCRGARHRIALVDGTLSALDHDPADLHREQLLSALGGTPMPCLHTIERAHRHPEELRGVRERLAHGDTAGALAVIEALLGPAALLPEGALREELEAAAERRVTHGLYRAGLLGLHRLPPRRPRPAEPRTRPRLAFHR
ncbi:hypothetical protein ACIA8O_03560 [Kitasatospora sp. NPDC051853]|uniref:hypothetical protein n=1 Tax=Kitasatospora sp. NPDC051853 TaxID=3364058 RepID=UPI0037B8BDD5